MMTKEVVPLQVQFEALVEDVVPQSFWVASCVYVTCVAHIKLYSPLSDKRHSEWRALASHDATCAIQTLVA